MTSKGQARLKMVLYGVMLLLAMLLEGPIFGTMHTRFIPHVMPIVVVSIALWEGAEKGCIFGLVGGMLQAWSTQLSMYGAWCIVILTIIGAVAGIVTERFLLHGWKTIFSLSAPAVFLTSGLCVIAMSRSGSLPGVAFFTIFIPEWILSMVFCPVIYPVTAYISRIGGFHG